MSTAATSVTPPPPLQPCPPSNLDLMLLASNKFVGCCDMAASQEHLVVLTKVEAQTLSAGSWLM